MREAVLFLCHLVNDKMLWRYAKLKEDLSGLCDVYWVFQTDNDISDAELHKSGVRIFEFSLDELKALNYTPIAKNLIPGSLHHVTLYFYQQHPEYDHFWFVENDVIFTGNWDNLVRGFVTVDADFITSCIGKRNDQNNNWTWWTSLKLGTDQEKAFESLLRSFNPIYRISRRALAYLDRLLRQPEVKGHAEVLVPTLLYYGGFRIIDFGGTGTFVPKEYRNCFYIQDDHPIASTFRWRPAFSRQEVEGKDIKGKLFHPVKC